MWKDCQELVVGRIRSTPEWSGEDVDVLSLGLFPGTFLEFSMDDRCTFYYTSSNKRVIEITFINKIKSIVL